MASILCAVYLPLSRHFSYPLKIAPILPSLSCSFVFFLTCLAFISKLAFVLVPLRFFIIIIYFYFYFSYHETLFSFRSFQSVYHTSSLDLLSKAPPSFSNDQAICPVVARSLALAFFFSLVLLC